jgi:type VI secretion system lysozyme-like protein
VPNLPNDRGPAYLPPLFDRLTTQAPASFTFKDVQESIQNELARLFNARVPYHFASSAPFSEEEVTCILPDFFGVSDFSNFSAEDEGSRERLELEIEAACEAYEPRLKNPRASLSRLDPALQKMSFQLSGEVAVGAKHLSVSFPVSFAWKPDSPSAPPATL